MWNDSIINILRQQLDTYSHYDEWMSILSQPVTKSNTVYYLANTGNGFANHMRSIRGLILFCLLENRGLRSYISSIV